MAMLAAQHQKAGGEKSLSLRVRTSFCKLAMSALGYSLRIVARGKPLHVCIAPDSDRIAARE
jgi:hypothetical protein